MIILFCPCTNELLVKDVLYSNRQLPMGWVYWPNRMKYTWRGAPCFFGLRLSKFGTLPATLATCQYWETFLDEAPCHSTTFGKLPELVGTLPKVPHLTLSVLEWIKKNLAAVTKSRCKNLSFVLFWPWPLTLIYQKSACGHQFPAPYQKSCR